MDRHVSPQNRLVLKKIKSGVVNIAQPFFIWRFPENPKKTRDLQNPQNIPIGLNKQKIKMGKVDYVAHRYMYFRF